MEILVSGAAGFIGSNLINKLLSQGHNVLGVDNFDPFYPRYIKEHNIAEHKMNPAFNFIELDITNTFQIKKKLVSKKFDVIIHLAAKAGVRPSILEPDKYFRTNVFGTLSMLELAKKNRIQKFVFASSSSVYGSNPNVPWHEDDFDLQPISPYAASKIAAEKLCQTYSYLYGIDTLALRFFTVYGPGQRPDLAIYKFFKLTYDNKPIPFFGDGKTFRDYTFIDDIVHGIIKAMLYSGKGFEIFNLGNHNTISLSNLVETIEQVLNKKVQLEQQLKQIGDVDQTFADIKKATLKLEYNPKTTLLEGLEAFKKYFDEMYKLQR